MIDRSHTEALLDRVAFAALTYYPDRTSDEPGYTVEEDVAYCLAPLQPLPGAWGDDLRELVGRTITDPTQYRQRLVQQLERLADA